MVEDFCRLNVVPSEQSRARLQASGVVSPYSDPKLRHPRAFEVFMAALAARGMLDFAREDGERVEPFFVSKKNGKLRLVVDCRRSNCHFTEAGGVSLCTGEGLAAIELGADEEIFVGGADLSDAFYHMGLPEPLRKYFTFRPVRAGAVGCTKIGGRAVAVHEKVYPRLAVIPMGWSWALWLCQKIHERIVEEAGSDPKYRITDKTCTPDLSRPCHTQYVDNFIAISSDADHVKKSVTAAIAALEARGLVVHEEDHGGESATAKLLGWVIDRRSGRLVASPERLWRARLAIRALLARGRAKGRDVERLLGHLVFISLVRREGLSLFWSCYGFDSQTL